MGLLSAEALGPERHPFEPEELASLRAERAASAHPLGDLPLVVLTRGISEESGPDSKNFEAEHRKDHEAIAALSTRGTMIVAEKSGHHVAAAAQK